MSSSAQTFIDLPVLPLPLSPEELYPLLMGEIEPELLEDSAVIEQRYVNEAEEETAKRNMRYQKAFEDFQRKYDDYMMQWKALFNKYKRDMNGYIEDLEELQMDDPFTDTSADS